MLEISVTRHIGNLQLRVDACCPHPATAILGPSGAGKTSLLNLVAGLLRPDQGEIRLDDTMLFSSKQGIDLPPEQRRLGYVFQDDLLFPHLSVVRNLRFGHDLLPAARRRVRLEQIVELLQLGPLLERRPARLSGGERQRVALGRALLASPRLLLLDEPLQAMDPGLKGRIIPYLRQVRSELRIPILYVTHSVAEVLELTGQVLVLRDGQVVAHGDLFRIAHQPGVLPLVEAGGLDNALQVQVTGADADAGVSVVSCCGHALKIPYCQRPVGARLFVTVRAEDIGLSRCRPETADRGNAVPAAVLSVSRIGWTVLAAVDIGVRLSVKLTPEAASALGLVPGAQVWCLIRPHAIRPGPDLG